MKRLLLICLLCAIFVSPAAAVALQKSLTFAWEQDQETLNILDHWSLYWSDAPGGPYEKAADIPYDGSQGGSYTSDQVLSVTGKIGQDTVKYFVLVACSETDCSGDSNEVSHNFGVITAPEQDLVTVTTGVGILNLGGKVLAIE